MALTNAQRNQLHRLFASRHRGGGWDKDRIRALSAEWEPLISPSGTDAAEWFPLCNPDGDYLGVSAPRWLCHLIGLRHAAVEIALLTQSGMIALQRRSITKPDWPGALDMSVAGHVSAKPEGSAPTWLETAWTEIEEEIGLNGDQRKRWMVEGDLQTIGNPYFSLDADPNREIPRYNAEMRQIFVGTLTGDALSAIDFSDQEAEGLALITPDTAWRLLTGNDVASGMRYTLPRVLDWIEKRNGGK